MIACNKLNEIQSNIKTKKANILPWATHLGQNKSRALSEIQGNNPRALWRPWVTAFETKLGEFFRKTIPWRTCVYQNCTNCSWRAQGCGILLFLMWRTGSVESHSIIQLYYWRHFIIGKTKMMLEKRRKKCKSEKDWNKISPIIETSENIFLPGKNTKRQKHCKTSNGSKEMKWKLITRDFILQIHNSSKYWEAYRQISRILSKTMTPPTSRKKEEKSYWFI